MTALALTLLGRPQIKVGDQQIELKSQKAQALFFYLVMSRQIHSRQSLAGLLWSDLEEAAARRNLRVELLKLRSVVDGYLETSRDTIGFARKSDYSLDVERFDRCLRGHEPTFEELQEAVLLYEGEFLEDFHVRDAPLFEEWVTAERERLSQMARQAILRLVEHYIQQRAYDRGLEWVGQLLKREPWLEEAHQQQMRLLALNGQRSAALAHYEVASQILDDEFGVPPSDETNALYDQIESGLFEQDSRPLAPPPVEPSSASIVPHTPPFQAPNAQLHFVGRHHELEALHSQLTGTTEERVIALVGMAGVGKTTLIAQLAHTLREHFVDGVLWAYTAESEPLDILGSWAQALGYDFSTLSDVENRAAALRGVLVDKQILILLDDVRSIARVRPLLVAGAAGVILLTTRDLDVATALNAQIYTLAEMTPHDGEQLLTRILGEERIEPELAAARQICTLLQNLPLAVEIAAQRLRSRPRRRLADMAARLQNTQERLDLAISDRAVRTSFLVSWESLDGELQRIFAFLGLWEGRSFGAPALAYLADLDLYTTEDRLFALTALSLLNEEENAPANSLRYRQHPLLADFAHEQLDDDQSVTLRLVRYYLRFAQEERTNYAALQPEWENLMVGLQTANRLTEWQVVLDFSDALTEPWFTRARYGEARQAYTLAQDAARELADQEALSTYLLRMAQALIEQDDYPAAKKLLEECKTICEQTDNFVNAAKAYYLMGRGAVEQGDYDDAEFSLAKSQQLFGEQSDLTGLAATYYQQGLLAYRRGEWGNARESCIQALAIQEEINDRFEILPTLRLLADIELEDQNYDAAESHCMRALVLCEELQSRGELGAIYYSLTVVSRLQGKFEQAKEYANQGLALFEHVGYKKFEAVTYYELSRIHAETENLEEARRVAQIGLKLLEEIDDNFNLVYVLRHLGYVEQASENHQAAKTYWHSALRVAEAQLHPLTKSLQQILA